MSTMPLVESGHRQPLLERGDQISRGLWRDDAVTISATVIGDRLWRPAFRRRVTCLVFLAHHGDRMMSSAGSSALFATMTGNV